MGPGGPFTEREACVSRNKSCDSCFDPARKWSGDLILGEEDTILMPNPHLLCEMSKINIEFNFSFCHPRSFVRWYFSMKIS